MNDYPLNVKEKLNFIIPDIANHTPSFKPPLLYWYIQREVYCSLSGGSLFLVKTGGSFKYKSTMWS